MSSNVTVLMPMPELAQAAKGVLDPSRALVDGIRRFHDLQAQGRRAALQASQRWRLAHRHTLLSQVDIGRIQDVTRSKVRIGALRSAGLNNVAQVLACSHQQLLAIPGVGDVTAQQVLAAAETLAADAEAAHPARLDPQRQDPAGTALLADLRRLSEAADSTRRVEADFSLVSAELPPLIRKAKTASGRIRWMFASSARKHKAVESLGLLDQWMVWSATRDLWSGIDLGCRILTAPAPDRAWLWRDFDNNSVKYYTVLEELTGITAPEKTRGGLTERVVREVKAQPLDTSLLRVSLRGYQVFGAKYALSQKRTILGDEMGLGKTVQAIAALAHEQSSGRGPFMVVCPASVLVNWEREIARHSELQTVKLHGSDAMDKYHGWARDGGVAITTFDTLKNLAPVPTAMLVIDEAHFIKNPQTARAQAARAWMRPAQRLLMMTGTPVDNHLDDFRRLITYAKPAVAATLGPAKESPGPGWFRSRVASVYLRRNASEVLDELPELIESYEWLTFSPSDAVAYRAAVANRNFMAMRRAAFRGTGPLDCAKIERLVELVDAAQEDGRKVVIFSFFRDVLDRVHEALGARAVGPLTGDTNPGARQRLVDDFGTNSQAVALLSQIVAGGTGLNIQAASVVILCEPQVKPSLESQAIKRVHRMGQTNGVNVYRLMVQNSVDERMLKILEPKKAQALLYAGRSDVADHTPSAVDVSEAKLSEEIIEAERRRLKMVA